MLKMFKQMRSMVLCALFFVFSSTQSQPVLSVALGEGQGEGLSQEEFTMLKKNFENFEDIFPAIFKEETAAEEDFAQTNISPVDLVECLCAAICYPIIMILLFCRDLDHDSSGEV